VRYEVVDRSWSLRVATADVFDDGVEGLYGEFVYAVEVARVLHDPGCEWEEFRDTLWEFLSRVFGLEAAGSWPAGLPGAGEVPAGDARAVAGWLRELDGDVQRPGATPRS
jgi:hypothetical protein